MPRYVCIHGHFYQPPRENPWLETVEVQDTASPWHDWNERITAECYRRNTASRILDDSNKIRKICNNYSHMSFNIGPTLMSWLQENAPRCYKGILNADAAGIERFSGHGPAIAQVYSHMIMPLANRRDKETQVKWGIADFKSHFGRMPEGMWLAETAVDTETLEVLAENGIRFTILAPNQASEVRLLKGGSGEIWRDVKWGKVDPGLAYRCNLPSGKNIALFFYDGAVSHDIAFGGLLNDGGVYAKRLIDARSGAGAILSHVATDGESYGHHHHNGDMALAYCLQVIENDKDAKLTIYGEFLEKNPPAYEARIVEKSAWSCAHGVERWRSDCGCSGGTPGYHQKWRGPLRSALDWLRDKLASQFDYEGAKYLKSPWEARNDYIDVIMDRSEESVKRWMDKHTSRKLDEDEKVLVMKLMESQRAAVLMYTSCGWFFDEISGLETTQILRYAARAISLTKELSGLDFEIEFLRLLEKAPSNVPELANGKRVYELLVKTSQVSFERMAAHYGMSELFQDLTPDFWEKVSGGRWEVTVKRSVQVTSGAIEGSLAFVVGEVAVSSKITKEKKDFSFAANYRGGSDVVCGVLPALESASDPFTDISELRAFFASSNDKKLIEIFGHNFFSLRHILNYAQRAMIDKLLERDTERLENSLSVIVDDYRSLFDYLSTLNVKAPSIICSAAGIIMTTNIIRAMKDDAPDIETMRYCMGNAQKWNVPLDAEQIARELNAWLMRQMSRLYEEPSNVKAADTVCDVITLFGSEFRWHLSLYEAQNFYYAAQMRVLDQNLVFDKEASLSFRKVGQMLRFAEEALALN